VQMVDPDEFNDIDRKAYEALLRAAATERGTDTPAAHAAARTSWLGWLWSAFTGTFTALAAAVHHLIG
jgi:hypothetical protein